MLALIWMDLNNLGQPAVLAVLVQVLIIDLSLAGENALVVGTLAAPLSQSQRRKAVALGVLAALLMRIAFALIATRLLQVVGLVLAGGLLLMWVAWKMWRETRHATTVRATADRGVPQSRSLASTAGAVALADLSMSLDNVLGVAGAAKDHPGILIIGLSFSVALMGLAASIIARYIDRYRWLRWGGIIVIVWVAAVMIWEGLTDSHIGLLHVWGNS